eukprot:m.51773 g.51773  ORF g.51773 m.51773 type:complete len:123 (-) comp18193_c0_seq1:142-510(-)
MSRLVFVVAFAACLLAVASAKKVCISQYDDAACTTVKDRACQTSGACNTGNKLVCSPTNSSVLTVEIYASNNCAGDPTSTENLETDVCTDFLGQYLKYTCSGSAIVLPSLALMLALLLQFLF